MFYFEIILIGISLSIDAFSLAFTIGLNSKSNISYKKYSFIVGLFHFFMPFLGFILKLLIVNKIVYIPNREILIVVLILLIFSILFDKNENKDLINPFIFALSVSIDSSIMGLTLKKYNILFSIISFSIISYIFTLIGFKMSIKFKSHFKDYSKIISIFILMIILAYNLLN